MQMTAEYPHPFPAPFTNTKAYQCIVSTDEWDGDTGIPALIDAYKVERLLADKFSGTPARPIHYRNKQRRERGIEKDRTAPVMEAETTGHVRKGVHSRDTATHKVCCCCKQLLPRDMFNRDRTTTDGLFGQCKECRSEYRKKIRQNKQKNDQ